MNIGIVSGKGGAGKTLVAVNLAFIASKNYNVNLYDLDVEEPNDFLFFNSRKYIEETVKLMIPKVDESKCSSCGICSKVCEFNAILNLGHETLVFPELCHSCYACLELCPDDAISESFKDIGIIRKSLKSNLTLIEGRLNTSETATPALIRKVKKEINNYSVINIIDSPPGTSCAVVEALKGMDYVIVVSEPTMFGIHDFQLIVKTVNSLNLNFGVIINKYVKENSKIENLCLDDNIDIIGKIPLSYEIARMYAHGDMICEKDTNMEMSFEKIFNSIKEKANGIIV